MSIHTDDELDDELALFEQQIQQVSTATPTFLLKPSLQVTSPTSDLPAKTNATTTAKPPAQANSNMPSFTDQAGVSMPVQPAITVPTQIHSDTLHSASKPKSFTLTKPLNRPHSHSPVFRSDPSPPPAVKVPALHGPPCSVTHQASSSPRYVQTTPSARNAGTPLAAEPITLSEPTKLVSRHLTNPSFVITRSVGNRQSGSTPTTSSESSTHRWYWNGRAWVWVARDAIPGSHNRSDKAVSSVTHAGVPTAANFVGAMSARRDFTVTNGLTAGVVPVLVDSTAGLSASTTVASTADSEASSSEKNSTPTIKRTAAGGVWKDPSLEEWPSNDHRLFVGDLGPDASDGDLSTAFSKYPSFNMARVVKDKRTAACRGYGFVSFASAHDMLAAIKEMNGKYVGSRPIKLQRSTWQKRNLDKNKWKQVRAIRTIAKR